ncbi:hypothetical protein GN956_G12204 [Arapaima gigas]
MTGNISEAQVDLSLNRTTALNLSNQAVNDAIHEFKVFNITITSLALCILTFTSLFCSISCHRRQRKRRYNGEYESAGGCDQHGDEGAIRAARRNPKARSPFSLLQRPQQRAADHTRIFFIYSNPAPVEEDNSKAITLQGGQSSLQKTQASREDLRDSIDGVILNPSMFYMQL